MVSASSARSRTSLVAILLVWIVLQVVIPRLSDMAASVISPSRTETVVSMQKSLLVKTIDREKAVALGARYEALFGPVRDNKLPEEPPDKKKEFEAFQPNGTPGPGAEGGPAPGHRERLPAGAGAAAGHRLGPLPALAERRVLQAF